MRRNESFGLGAIHADDELLDRLGRRDDVDSFESMGGLESLLAQWTAQIDTDAESVADRSGPWGLRGRGADSGAEVTPIVPRTVRIPMSRAAAVAGALVITMSGGGVAAAMTGQDVPLMSKFVASARPAAPEATPTSGQQLDDAVVAAIGSRLRAGQPQEARKIVSALEQIVGANPDPALAAKVDQLSQQVEQAEILAAGVPTSTSSPTDLPSVLAAIGPTTTVLGLPSSPVSALTTVTSGPLAPTTPTSTEQPPVVVPPTTPSISPDEPREGAPTTTPSTPSTGTSSPSTIPGVPTSPSGSGTSTSDPSTPSTPSTGSPTSGSTSSPTHGTSPTPSDTATSSGVRPTLPTPSAPVTGVSPSVPPTSAEPEEPATTPSPTPTPTAQPPSSSAPGGSTSVSPTTGTSDATSEPTSRTGSTSVSTTSVGTSKVTATKKARKKVLSRGGTSSQRVRSAAARPATSVPNRAVVPSTSTATSLPTS